MSMFNFEISNIISRYDLVNFFQGNAFFLTIRQSCTSTVLLGYYEHKNITHIKYPSIYFSKHKSRQQSNLDLSFKNGDRSEPIS